MECLSREIWEELFLKNDEYRHHLPNIIKNIDTNNIYKDSQNKRQMYFINYNELNAETKDIINNVITKAIEPNAINFKDTGFKFMENEVDNFEWVSCDQFIDLVINNTRNENLAKFGSTYFVEYILIMLDSMIKNDLSIYNLNISESVSEIRRLQVIGEDNLKSIRKFESNISKIDTYLISPIQLDVSLIEQQNRAEETILNFELKLETETTPSKKETLNNNLTQAKNYLLGIQKQISRQVEGNRNKAIQDRIKETNNIKDLTKLNLELKAQIQHIVKQIKQYETNIKYISSILYIKIKISEASTHRIYLIDSNSPWSVSNAMRNLDVWSEYINVENFIRIVSERSALASSGSASSSTVRPSVPFNSASTSEPSSKKQGVSGNELKYLKYKKKYMDLKKKYNLITQKK